MKNNNWYSKNSAKNPSLKLNISVYSQLLVTEGLTGPTFLNYLSPWRVHIPPHVISFSENYLQRVCLDINDSLRIHTPFARGQFTHWDMASVREQEFNSSLMGQVHVVQDPTPPLSLGTRPALTPNLLASGMREERNAELIPEAAVRTVGPSPGRVSADWTVHSQLDTIH